MSSEHTSVAAAEAKFYVYVHCKADDGEPFYAGKGQGRRAWSKAGRSTWWKSIVAKHGLVVKIQKHFQDESETFASEVETIAILRDLGYELCNLTLGGDGASGAVRSAETREKLAELARQRMASPEARRAMGERSRKLWSDPEYRQAQTDRARQQWSSPEARRAKAERTRQQMASPEARARISGESNPAAKLSDEACRIMFRLRARGLSHAKIAAQVGCHQPQVSRILSGKQRRNIYLEFHPDES